MTSCETANDIWDALRRHFEGDTLANNLKKLYFRKEMKEGTSKETNLVEMKKLTDKQSLIGAPISEEEQVVILLGSMPLSYSTLVTAQKAQS